ncbi:MAG: hypothetical protein V3U87_03015 [Methylococcaceae bacterium]
MSNDKDNSLGGSLSVAGSTYGGMIAGSLGGVDALVTGGIGGLVAGLVPVLVNLPISKKYNEKIHNAFSEINDELGRQSSKLNILTESQFKLINESLITLTQTTELEKIEYLKIVIQNSLNEDNLKVHEATILSRIIRDISSEEIKFVISNFTHKRIYLRTTTSGSLETNDGFTPTSISTSYDGDREDNLVVEIYDEKASIVNGLSNLGILLPAETTHGGQNYMFSPITVKLIVLVKV